MSINFNHLKTFCSALIQKMKSFRGNWNQNNPTADDYIKNRPFYSEVKKQTITLVDNLTSDTDYNYWPKCTFIPGQSYDVTYNGVLYPNLVCYQRGGYNIICEDVPCYIDDDGGNSLYIDSNDDSWIISITTVEENEIIHKLDKKFIDMPKGIVTEDSLENTLENNLAPVAFDGDYTSLSNTPDIYTDVVRYNTTQLLYESQRSQARTNIDVYSKKEVSANYMQMKDATTTMPSKESWESIAYGNGRFVVITSPSYVAYSEDGITWQTSTLPSGSWRSVAYGNEKFVAVAYNSSTVAYSEDGITWQTSTLPLNYWRSVAYGNGKFVAVGSNKAAYSEDGIVWHEGSAITSSVGAIAYGNGKFVAISTSNGDISYSEDGAIWHKSTPPISTAWSSITYGNDKFVILANASSVMLYSEDGITWTSTSMPAKVYESVVYGNGKFVAAAANTNKIYCSIDGITWSAYDLPSSAIWSLVAYGNGKFVVVASGPSNKTAYSEDGITWTDKYKILTQNGVTITPKQLGFNKTDLTGYATEEYVVEHNTSEDAHSDIRILVKSLTEQLNAITGAKDSIVLNDSVTGFEYVVQVQNGNLVSSLKCTGIEITTMPDKVEYTDGENFDPTGMVVVATYPDGSTKEIIDYTYYSDILTKDMNGIEISYTEAGFTYTNIAHISVNPFDAAKALIDFYYTDNKNGTYTITGWKQTLNGESSTELIVPSNPSIIV